MDLEVRCPKCNRKNFVLMPSHTNTWAKKCMWCKEGMVITVIVRPEKDIERFLEQQRPKQPSGMPDTLSQESDKSKSKSDSGMGQMV